MATLGDLGLSDYESRVYRALLRIGPTTAKELSGASDVPLGRIYDVLNTLESSDMVRSQESRRPKKYVPVEPDRALKHLLEEKRNQLDAELQQYRSVVDELESQLEAAEPDGEQFWTVAIGPEDAVDLLVERLGTATDRIVMVASKPASGFDLGTIGERVANQLEAALDRGVDVSILAAPGLTDVVPDDVMNRYERMVDGSDGFDIRFSEEIWGTFNLLDRSEVCVEVRNPLNGEEMFALIDLTDPVFAANVAEEFEPRWKTATPFP